MGTLAALVLAWIGAWHVVAGIVESRFDAWAAGLRAEGLSVTHAERRVAGFPLTWRLTVERPEMAGAGPTGWQWRGAAVIATIAPWAWRDMALEWPGEHRLWLGQGRGAENWVIWAQRPDGRIQLDANGQLDRLSLDFADVSARRMPDPAVTRIERLNAELAPYRQMPPGHRSDVFDALVSLQGLILSNEPVRGINRRIARAKLDAAFMGKLPPGTLGQSVRAWRDDGGTVEVKRLEMEWGQLEIDGSGTLALDGEDRPLGAFTARIAGLRETLEALGQAGLISPREAAAMNVAVSLFARASPGDERKRLNLPLSAQDGLLSIAGLPLMRLGPLSLD